MAGNSRESGMIQSCPPDLVVNASYQMDGDGTESKKVVTVAAFDPDSNATADIVMTKGTA